MNSLVAIMLQRGQRHYALLLVAAVFAVYLNALRGPFQFDDYMVIIEEPTVHSFSAWLSYLPQGIRPLLKFTYTLNWVSGMGVLGFHLFNIAVHAANALLVYLLSLRLISVYPEGRRAAFFAALFFVLHPVQTEAVTYISGRSSSLMAMFYLGSLLAYDRGVRLKNKLALYLLSPLLFVMAVAAKETAVTLPFALLLWEAVSRDRSEPWRKALCRQAVHWALLAGLFALLVLNQRYLSLFIYSARLRTAWSNLLNQINGVFYLLGQTIFVNRLNIDPDLPVVSGWSVPLAFRLAFLLMLFAAGLMNFRKRPWLWFGVLWVFLQLLPTNSIIPRADIANDRQMYLPIFGLSLVFGVYAQQLYAELKGKAGVLAVFLLLGLFTVLRNEDFRSEIALWEDTREKSPAKARVHNNLGYAYFLEGRYEDARAAYLSALAIDPDLKRARNNLALINGISPSTAPATVR